MLSFYDRLKVLFETLQRFQGLRRKIGVGRYEKRLEDKGTEHLRLLNDLIQGVEADIALMETLMSTKSGKTKLRNKTHHHRNHEEKDVFSEVQRHHRRSRQESG